MAFIFIFIISFTYLSLFQLQVPSHLHTLASQSKGPCDCVPEQLLADTEEVLPQVYLQSSDCRGAVRGPPEAFSQTDGEIATVMRATEELTDVRRPRAAQTHFSEHILSPISILEYRVVSGRLGKSDILLILI